MASRKEKISGMGSVSLFWERRNGSMRGWRERENVSGLRLYCLRDLCHFYMQLPRISTMRSSARLMHGLWPMRQVKIPTLNVSCDLQIQQEESKHLSSRSLVGSAVPFFHNTH